MENNQDKCKDVEKIYGEGVCIWNVSSNSEFFTTCIFTKPHLICPYIFNEIALKLYPQHDDTGSPLIKEITRNALDFTKQTKINTSEDKKCGGDSIT